MPVLSQRRILVVEDDYLIAETVRQALERAGAKVAGPVASVRDALQLIAETDLDAAVLDFAVNDGTTEPVIEALQRSEKPFVLATAYEVLDLPASLASSPQLVKPVKADVLISALGLLLADVDA